MNKKTILDYIFELIDTPKCSSTVIDFVMNIIYNFVTYGDFKEDAEITDENGIEGKSFTIESRPC